MKQLLQGTLALATILLFFNFNINAQCTSGDCIEGFGTYECCGYVYTGLFMKGEKYQGTLTRKDSVYIGEFKNDMANGMGEMYFKSGTWYKGEFQNNQFNGQGEIHFTDGTWYTGSFINHQMSGYGVHYSKKNGTYIGQMVGQNYSGLGVRIITNKRGETVAYKFGEFDENTLNGVGAILVPGVGFDFGEVWNGGIDGVYCYADASDSLSEFYPYLSDSAYHELQRDTFAIEFSIEDSVMYSLSGYRKSVQMLLGITKGGETINYYTDKKRGLFFVSNEGTPLVGKVINIKGEIFEASITTSPVIALTILGQLYTP